MGRLSALHGRDGHRRGELLLVRVLVLLFMRIIPPVAIAELKEVLPTPMRPTAIAGPSGYGGDQ